MSQEELGLATGVHRNYIGGVERGERQPTVAVIAKLAASMDCKLSELFRRAEQFAAGSGDDDMPTLGVRPASSLADSSEGRARQRP